MIKYDGKNKHILSKYIAEMSITREYDALMQFNIFENILTNLTINEDLLKDIIKSIDYKYGEKKHEEFAMQNILCSLALGEYASEAEFDAYFESHFLNCVHREDAALFKENPYLKNIKIDISNKFNKDNVEFKMDYYNKYEIFLSNTSSQHKNLIVKPCLGYFNEKVWFPSLLENGDVWMSITPSEINTMKHHIAKMKGDVLVFGLGLGYFPYMSALMNNVKSVTVVELNQDIIDIFNSCIYPQMGKDIQSKIKVIQGDAKDIFLDTDFMRNFNTCFIDIWKNSKDGVPLYCYFKENEKLHKIKPCYWLEDDFELHYQDAMSAYIIYLISKSYHDDKEAQKEYLEAIRLRFFVRKIENYFNDKKYLIKDKNDIQNLIFNKTLMRKIASKPLDSQK